MNKKTHKNIVWHVFSYSQVSGIPYDDFVPTRKEALKLYRKLDPKEYPDARIWIEEDDEDGNTVWEDHRFGRGEFPL